MYGIAVKLVRSEGDARPRDVERRLTVQVDLRVDESLPLTIMSSIRAAPSLCR
jgi:hypothetical protein